MIEKPVSAKNRLEQCHLLAFLRSRFPIFKNTAQQKEMILFSTILPQFFNTV